MIDGRKLAMQNGGLRKSTLWKEAKDYVLGFQSGQTWSRKIGEPLLYVGGFIVVMFILYMFAKLAKKKKS